MLDVKEEGIVKHYATMIGRKVGRNISSLVPLLDAHLNTGDRVNATLAPISTKGNTITIRKFSRDPWTITKFLQANTISLSAAALVWLAMQYEMSAIVTGGTATGKTSTLNVLMLEITLSNPRSLPVKPPPILLITCPLVMSN